MFTLQHTRIHYAWIIVLSGVFTLFSCLGLGRFALGMLLPSMGSSLELSYTQMGFISTGNFIGYLFAVLVCGQLIRHLGERKTIFVGLIVVGLSMLLVSQNSDYRLITLLYFFTGVGSGAANITVMSLVAHWFSPKFRGRAAGFMIFGNGLGIVASGLMIPWMNSLWFEDGWRIGWATFGITVLLAALLTALLIRNKPQDMQLLPLGTESTTPVSTSVEATDTPPSTDSTRKLIAHLGALYFMFGFTYVIYATFIVTTLVEQYQFSEARAGTLWMVIGIISVSSGALFGWVSDHFGRKTGLTGVYAIQTLSYLLVASELGSGALYVSMVLFGLTAFSIPAIIAATISDLLPPLEAGKTFGYVTFFFALGQISGPTLAGYLAEQSHSFTSSYLLAACTTAIAIVFTLLLKSAAKR